jgi:hypothetical protein
VVDNSHFLCYNKGVNEGRRKMKVLIYIPKRTFEQNKFLIDQGFGTIIDAFVSEGKVLDEMTNGDVLVVLFPKAEYEIRPCVVIFSFGGLKRELAIDWWNAPYKGEE